jgi:hypothetical protein
MNDENGVDAPESASVRKIRSFKRIRGESRRERRAGKVRDRARACACASSGVARSRWNSDSEDSFLEGDDDDIIYDAHVENRSDSSRGWDSLPLKLKAQPNMSGLGKSEEAAMEDHEAFVSSDQVIKPHLLKKLKVVLLLMDPQTCRFELLQLEFDSLQALVSDVLAQIPVSAKEHALRKQAYSGVCGPTGQAMASDQLLATFCHGNNILVAIPTGLSVKECARLATPILLDVNVGALVRHSYSLDLPCIRLRVPTILVKPLIFYCHCKSRMYITLVSHTTYLSVAHYTTTTTTITTTSWAHQLLSSGIDEIAWRDDVKPIKTEKAPMDGEKKPKSTCIRKETAAPLPVEEKSSGNKVSVFASVSVVLLAILGPVQMRGKPKG